MVRPTRDIRIIKQPPKRNNKTLKGAIETLQFYRFEEFDRGRILQKKIMNERH